MSYIHGNGKKRTVLSVVSVDILCSKCKRVMKSITSIENRNSIVLDPSKNTAAMAGDANPVVILKIPFPPRTCQRCDVLYVISEDEYNCSSIWLLLMYILVMISIYYRNIRPVIIFFLIIIMNVKCANELCLLTL